MKGNGAGVRVAVIDSGINPSHPHVGAVEGGVALTAEGESDLYLDYIGHGTAVAAAIREKAPAALLYAVKVFDQRLSTRIERITRAIDWAAGQQVDIVNLSLGTLNEAHRPQLEAAVGRAAESGVVIVSGRGSLPGSLPGVLQAALDWQCPRDRYRAEVDGDRPYFLASGYPREIPGVPVEHNLHGISFAVANITGFAVRARQLCPGGGVEALERVMLQTAGGAR